MKSGQKNAKATTRVITQNGNLTFGIGSAVPSELWGSDVISENPADNNGKVVSINGSEDYGIHNRYHEIDLTTSEAKIFHLSAIAVQAYYNTVDIASLLFEVKEGKRDPSPYSKDRKNAIDASTPYGSKKRKILWKDYKFFQKNI